MPTSRRSCAWFAEGASDWFRSASWNGGRQRTPSKRCQGRDGRAASRLRGMADAKEKARREARKVQVDYQRTSGRCARPRDERASSGRARRGFLYERSERRSVFTGRRWEASSRASRSFVGVCPTDDATVGFHPTKAAPGGALTPTGSLTTRSVYLLMADENPTERASPTSPSEGPDLRPEGSSWPPPRRTPDPLDDLRSDPRILQPTPSEAIPRRRGANRRSANWFGAGLMHRESALPLPSRAALSLRPP